MKSSKFRMLTAATPFISLPCRLWVTGIRHAGHGSYDPLSYWCSGAIGNISPITDDVSFQSLPIPRACSLLVGHGDRQRWKSGICSLIFEVNFSPFKAISFEWKFDSVWSIIFSVNSYHFTRECRFWWGKWGRFLCQIVCAINSVDRVRVLTCMTWWCRVIGSLKGWNHGGRNLHDWTVLGLKKIDCIASEYYAFFVSIYRLIFA